MTKAVNIDVNDLIASLKQQRNVLSDENALQAAIIANLERQMKDHIQAEQKKDG